jgi:hypothetical protein
MSKRPPAFFHSPPFFIDIIRKFYTCSLPEKASNSINAGR